MTLEDMINRLRNMPLIEEKDPETLDLLLETEVNPPFEPKISLIETELNVKIPEQILECWGLCSSITLLRDKRRNLRGLRTHPPDERIIEVNRYILKDVIQPEDYLTGDLILAEFGGEQDQLIVRCDPSADDFGELLIAMPIDSREDWFHMGNSLVRFLKDFIEHNGYTYWA